METEKENLIIREQRRNVTGNETFINNCVRTLEKPIIKLIMPKMSLVRTNFLV